MTHLAPTSEEGEEAEARLLPSRRSTLGSLDLEVLYMTYHLYLMQFARVLQSALLRRGISK